MVRHLIARVLSVFGLSKTLYSDQENELPNQIVELLQSVFGFKKTRTTAYCWRGNSVLDRVHSTVYNMLAMYSNLACEEGAEPQRLSSSRTTRSTPKRWRRVPTILCLCARLLSPSISFSVFLLLMHHKTYSTNHAEQ